MASIHTESIFESAIIEHLTANGWLLGKDSDFSRDLAFDKKAVSGSWRRALRIRLKGLFQRRGERKYYLRMTAEMGWSRNVLLHQIKTGAYSRHKEAYAVSGCTTGDI